MNKEELATLINTKVTSYREYRIKYADMILNDEKLFIPLLEIAFDETNEAQIKVSWVLDFVMRKKLEWIYPHLDYFTEHIDKISNDSAVRPISRICELLAKKYNSKSNSEIKEFLTSKHIEKIIETGFDWLISQHKVAVKAYTMETLFYFGKEYDWVHEELRLVLQKEISNGSPAYKARGKKILQWIRKLNK